MRSTRSVVTFSKPFIPNAHDGELPAGQCEILVEDELLKGLSVSACPRTATYLVVRGGRSDRTEAVSEGAVDAALAHDRSLLDG